MTLLVGNGVNRLMAKQHSWRKILQDLAESVNAQEVMSNYESKPFTLLYDALVLHSKRVPDGDSDLELKENIAKKISELSANEFHNRIIESGVRHILTTNYDYNLERASSKLPERANLARERKYNVFRRQKVGNCFVWHVHGECNNPNTILLGHEQYCGYLQKLRNYATDERKSEIGSPFKRRVSNFEDTHEKYSWLDLFFQDDIHIIGLSLDYTEIELWWAISYKERLRRRKFKVGDTTFHTISDKAFDERERAKQSLLESLGVNVKKHQTRSYPKSYDQVFTKLGI